MKMGYFFLFLLILIFSGCTKADPEAYKRDPILLDFQTQVGALSGQLEANNKEIETTKKELKTIVPQTGQAAQYTKKINDLEKKSAVLQQQIQFFKIHIESRARKAQSDYLEAFKNKKEWPNKQEVESYLAEKRFRTASMSWNQKNRIKEYKESSGSQVGGQGGTSHEQPPSGH